MKKRGVALVTTIMILLVLTLLSVGMMFTIKNETAISVYQVENVKTVHIAEAALDEVKYRMKLSTDNANFIGDTLSPLDPAWTTYVVFGNPPADTGGIFYTKSIQCSIPSWDVNNPELDYTTVSFDPNTTLKVRHKTNEAGTMIYFFDSKSQRQFLGSPALVEQYPPVEIVEITSRSHNAVKKITAEISKQEVDVVVYSALSSATLVWKMTGNTDVYVCGHNHEISTPYNVCPYTPGTAPPHQPGTAPAKPGTGTATSSKSISLPGTFTPTAGGGGGGGANAVSCWMEDSTYTPPAPLYHVETAYDAVDHPTSNHFYYNKFAGTFNYNRIEYDKFCSDAGCVAGIATTSAGVGNYGATKSHMFGNPDIIVRQTIDIPPIWEVLGLNTEAELNDLADEYGGWKNTIENAADDDDISFFKFPDGTQLPFNSEIHSRGVIWVTGDCLLKAGHRSFFHKGLIYVGDDLRESAAGGNFDLWILGAMIIKDSIDEIHTSGNKRLFFMYSKDALTKSVESSASYFKVLGWKENN